MWLNPRDDVLYVRTPPPCPVRALGLTGSTRLRPQVSHSVAALTRARTFSRLYVKQLVDLLERANLYDHESDFFADVDFYSQENERERRRPWTRCVSALWSLPLHALTRPPTYPLQFLRGQPHAYTAARRPGTPPLLSSLLRRAALTRSRSRTRATQKTRGNETYHAVLRELEPLRQRGWLTTWNGTHVVPGTLPVGLTGHQCSS